MENIRYDRQVRLWGDDGQNSIGQTSVCILGSSAIATEILKNLVLAGIKSFHIIDDAKIQTPDLGQNFFVRESDIGKPRAQIVDLNPSVNGTYSLKNFEHFSNFIFFLDFSVVISTNLIENDAILLSDYLVLHDVPFLYTRVCGLFGYLHLSFKQHVIWNNHNTENSPHDFRLDMPFQELMDYSNSIDLDALNHEQHSHVPYIIIYIKALDMWRKNEALNNQAIPDTYQKRKAFEKILMDLRKADKDGNLFEENFHEAKLNLFKSFSRTSNKIPSNLLTALNDPKAANLETCEKYLQTLSSKNKIYEVLRPFWILSAALNEFFQIKKHLPLSGNLPDMTSFSDNYAKILNIFREQANKEANEIYEISRKIFDFRQALVKSILLLHETNMEETAIITDNNTKLNNFLNSGITFELCKQFCKNASRIALLNGKSLKDEYILNMEPTTNENDIPEIEPKTWFVLLRAMDKFYNEKNRFPGTNGVPCFIDSQDLRRRVTNIFVETKDFEIMASEHVLIPPYMVDEICRYGAAELHVISAIFGGIVAQETIKVFI